MAARSVTVISLTLNVQSASFTSLVWGTRLEILLIDYTLGFRDRGHGLHIGAVTVGVKAVLHSSLWIHDGVRHPGDSEVTTDARPPGDSFHHWWASISSHSRNINDQGHQVPFVK